MAGAGLGENMMNSILIIALVLLLLGVSILPGCTIHHKKPAHWAAERPLSKPEEVTGQFADENRLGYYLFDHKAAGFNITRCSISLHAGSTGSIAFQDGGTTVLEWPFTYAMKEGWLEASPSGGQTLPADNGIIATTKHILWLRPNAEAGVAVKAASRSVGVAVVVPMMATDVYWFRLTRVD